MYSYPAFHVSCDADVVLVMSTVTGHAKDEGVGHNGNGKHMYTLVFRPPAQFNRAGQRAPTH